MVDLWYDLRYNKSYKKSYPKIPLTDWALDGGSKTPKPKNKMTLSRMSWGLNDTESYNTLNAMREGLTPKLAWGEARVLKRNRGQSGSGVWLVWRTSLDGNNDAGVAAMQVLL